MFSNSNTGICARLVAAAAAFGGATLLTPNATAAPADVRVSISISGHDHSPAPRPIVQRERDYAGTLTIDGHVFRINTCEPVQHQIRDAFEHMGYRATCTGRAVRISTHHGGPEACWRNGDYTLEFRERRASVSVTPIHDCDDNDYGAHYRYCFDGTHGRYYTYHEVQRPGHGHGHAVAWTAVGASVFIDHDEDHHHSPAITGRTDDRSIAQPRYQPNDRRVTTAAPQARNAVTPPNVELRKRSVPAVREPVASDKAKQPEPKRSTAAARPAPIAKPTIVPADRFGGLKPAQRTNPTRLNDGAPRASTPAAKPSENKRAMW